MSTRATYKFSIASELAPDDITIYAHYDGYPEGAANKFSDMLMKKGNLSDRFIRAVDYAETTKNHSVHGDTEYRYDIETQTEVDEHGEETGYEIYMLTAYRRDLCLNALYEHNQSPKWELFFNNTVYAFIKQYDIQRYVNLKEGK